jgi:hypothetical protein
MILFFCKIENQFLKNSFFFCLLIKFKTSKLLQKSCCKVRQYGSPITPSIHQNHAPNYQNQSINGN